MLDSHVPVAFYKTCDEREREWWVEREMKMREEEGEDKEGIKRKGAMACFFGELAGKARQCFCNMSTIAKGFLQHELCCKDYDRKPSATFLQHILCCKYFNNITFVAKILRWKITF